MKTWNSVRSEQCCRWRFPPHGRGGGTGGLAQLSPGAWGEEVSAPGLKVLDVIKHGQLGRALLVRTVRRGIYLEVVGEIFRVVFENHSLNIWTGLSYQCHLFIWMEMYFLWGLKYLQLQFLLKCPSCFINEGLVAESFTQRNSSL